MDVTAWSVLFAGVSGVAAIVTASIAGWALVQASHDSKERSRPVVVAELRHAGVKGSQSLVIRNYGLTVARDVQITFDPQLPKGDSHPASKIIRERYRRPIPTMPPGMELKNIYLIGTPGPGPNFVPAEPIPEQVTIVICYKSANSKDSYVDSYLLDTDLIGKESSMSEHS